MADQNSKSITRRQRLARAYNHEPLDRPCVYVRRAFPKEDPTYDRLRAYLDEHTELKWPWNVGWDPHLDVETTSESGPEGFERRVEVLHTPAGDLRASKLHAHPTDAGQAEEYFIKSVEDIAKYLSLPMPDFDDDVSQFFKLQEQMGDRGIVDVGLISPIGVIAPQLGSEFFAIASAMHRDEVHALLEREMRNALAQLEHLLARGVGPYFYMLGEEYVVPPLHGPRDFQDFVVKYEKPICDRIHEAGGWIHMHCHGSIRRVFDGFLEMGVDVLHPFEAPPMGDITPAEAKALAQDRLTLEGNIQIADFYHQTADEVRAQTAALIRDTFGDGQGLIVCPSASPYIRGAGETSFDKFKAMIDTVCEWTA